MSLTSSTVERLAEWCRGSDMLADIRATARRDFFGYNEPGEAHYMFGTEDVNSRERRFLGWFSLSFKLPDGRRPAELAASAILSGSDLDSVIRSVQNSRYVMAIIR